MDISTSLLKALDVMSYITGHVDGVSLPTIARTLKMPRSSVVRIVNTFESYGFLERAERRYRTTTTFHEWAVRDRHQLLRQKYRACLEAVAREVEELVLLGVEENGAIIHVDYVEWDHVIRVAPAPQTRHGLEQNAMGKLALAKRPDRLKKIQDAHLRAEVETAVKIGVAWNREETDKGMIVMATFGRTRSPAEPMMAVAWPTIRFTEEKARLALRVVREQVAKL